jgi:hypothetical protein
VKVVFKISEWFSIVNSSEDEHPRLAMTFRV